MIKPFEDYNKCELHLKVQFPFDTEQPLSAVQNVNG
jgi:hypothetical protein